MDIQMTLDSKELQQKLNSLTGKELDKIISKAEREGAKVFQAAIAEAAPERVEIGDSSKSTALPPGALKSDVVIQKTPGSYLVRFGSLTAHVAMWVEFGHRLVRGGTSKKDAKTGRVRGKGKEIGQVEPHPFFRKTFERVADEAAQVISTSIQRSISRKFKGK